MFEQFQNLELFPVTVFDVMANLGAALVCGIIIALVYRFIYKGPSYSVTYVNSLVLLTLITSIVILVIGNNLARAFGLVGAMSIIRFRTAVRDVQDIVFIFFALSVGMAAGVGLHVIALTGTIIISFIAIVLVTFNFGAPRKREYLLQITYTTSEENEKAIDAILKKYVRKLRLINMKNLGGSNVEVFYQVDHKVKEKSGELLRELNANDQIINASIFFDEDDTDQAY
ncbi:MAG: DUF4956 domain-containing protein [Bacteroidales bacterium]|nr:DUF4956 domain-containing protein [Bacteroidales bacterium]